MKPVKRGRLRSSNGTQTSRLGHSTAKYAKNPRIKANLAREGFKSTRKAAPIDPKFATVEEWVRYRNDK